jgi:uncharacterized protein YndB with AHSA1/START domain
MSTFNRSINISASPERVWQVLADIERWNEWTASVSRVERVTSGELGIGSRVRIFQPKLQPVVWTITQWQPNHSFVWESVSPGFRAVAEHIITPNQNGCTVTLTFEFSGLVGVLISALSGRMTRGYIEMEANGLKTRSEKSV